MGTHRPTRRRAALTAAVVTLLALCALLPATAAADSTSLTLVASPDVVAFDRPSVLTGTLMNTTTMTAVGGQPILVESAASGTGPWTTLAVITTVGGTPGYYTGTYTLAVRPRDKTFYRMSFPGGTGLDPSVSAAVAVTPKVWLSKPRVPRRVIAGQRFKVVGYIQPRHAAGLRNVVKFQFYRYTGSVWVFKRARWATTSNYLNFTKLTLTTSIKTPGRWRVRAFAPADARHADTYSVFSRTIRVVR